LNFEGIIQVVLLKFWTLANLIIHYDVIQNLQFVWCYSLFSERNRHHFIATIADNHPCKCGFTIIKMLSK